MKHFQLVSKPGITSNIVNWQSAIDINTLIDDFGGLPMDAPVYSFQPVTNVDSEFLPYDSSTRILASKLNDVICLGLQCGSQAADLILWDLAHSVAVGGSVVIFEPVAFDDCILVREYFNGVFDIHTEAVGAWIKTIFRKVAPTPSECESGLDNWTFGLPVQTASRALIERIASDVERLGIPRFEVIFAASSLHSDLADYAMPIQMRVLICDEATITRKKNLIADNAVFANLCIFHDRVILPLNFKNAIENFGDHYCLAGFQQLFFDPKREELERYSDYHVDLGDLEQLIKADGLGERGQIYTQALETRLGYRARFAEAHPAEYSRTSYHTGSLCLAKRSIWRMVRQNEDIDWNELEDVEFADHAIRGYGIPSRLNPFAFGFTTRVRAIMIGEHTTTNRRDATEVIQITNDYVGGQDTLSGLDQDKIRTQAWQLFKEFGLSGHDILMREHIFHGSMEGPENFANFWITLLYRLVVSRRRKRIEQLLTLFSVAVFGFEYDRGSKRQLTNSICEGTFFIDAIVNNDYFMRALANASSLVKSHPGTTAEILWVQLARMWRRGGDYVYPYDSFAEFGSNIWASVGEVERLGYSSV